MKQEAMVPAHTRCPRRIFICPEGRRQPSAGIGTGMDKNGGKSRGFFKSFICLFVFCIYDDDLLLYGFIE